MTEGGFSLGVFLSTWTDLLSLYPDPILIKCKDTIITSVYLNPELCCIWKHLLFLLL